MSPSARQSKRRRLVSRSDLFHAVHNRQFGRSTCFLCGTRLSTKTRSDEHVIPRWIQDRFHLWNHRLNLLNRTSIPYRQLKVPCCCECNGQHLAPIEAAIQGAVDQGPAALAALDPIFLFLWLGKIFYGIVYKEFLLPMDRRHPHRRPIVPRSLLKRYEMHHYFLQAARIPMEFRSSFPASIFIFSAQAPVEAPLQFDFHDSLRAMTISVRLGRVGILAALQDAGAQRDGFAETLAPYLTIDLHPLQFIELTTMFFYKASLLNRVPKYMIMESTNPVLVLQLPLAGMSTKPLFDEWDHETYARLLARAVMVPVEQIFIPPRRVMTWLHDENGRVRSLDLKTQAWPP